MSSKREIMTEGGKRIGWIKGQLINAVKAGVTPLEIDVLCERLIKEGGDKPSFKMEPGYFHTTCVNVNEGMVHGIPNKNPFKPGDIVKVDLGLYHDGFHLDTAFSLQIPPHDPKITRFLETGRRAEKAAIDVSLPGNTVFDIGETMQRVVEADGYNVVRDLTGHGIGRQMHMEPYIPCFADKHTKRHVLELNQTIAIETMYTMGDWHLVEDPDGWTLSTQDGSVTGYFEETIYISENGPIILTQTI